MSDRVTANKNSKTGDNVVKLGLFERPLANGKVREKFTLYDYFTFRNIVIGIGVLTGLFFLRNVVPPRTALLIISLLALAVLVMIEMSSRRRWERDLIGQFHRLGSDYDRLVRDVARNRNDTASLRKKLSDAAVTVARSYDKAPGEAVENRMIRAIAEQLSGLSDVAGEEQAEVGVLPADPEEAGDMAASDLHLTEAQVLQLLNAAVKQDRVDLFLQPVVGLPQRKVRFYEMFSRIRIRPESYLPAVRYIGIANRQDLMPVIDNLLLLRGLQIIRNTEDGDYNRAFFFNITSLTLNDPKFMGDLVEFIAQNRPLAPRLIFEMGQRDLSTMSADILPVLDGLSKLGCRFSMDQVKSLSVNFQHLEDRHIRFVKVEASLLMSEVREMGGLQRMKRLKAEFDRNGIDLVVEKIETDKQLLELLDVDIDYGQGYLFGKPALYDKN
jgi:cyclic-di-GMP phosphodiesterase TipF (flagellum assembly factor)